MRATIERTANTLHQTCVVGGWTEPRGSRPFFGGLLLGVYDADGTLQYVGHTGSGFTDAELGRVWKELRQLKTKACPFETTPRTGERAHWVKPKLEVDVRFTGQTADGKLRHPTYVRLLGHENHEGRKPNISSSRS
jgi:bifunctional non-homologous end joining protein LigD